MTGPCEWVQHSGDCTDPVTKARAGEFKGLVCAGHLVRVKVAAKSLGLGCTHRKVAAA